MGKQQGFVKAGAAVGQARGQGGASQRGEPPLGKGEGNQARAGVNQRQVKLAGDVIGEAGGAHLGDAFAAGGQHQIGAAHPLRAAIAQQCQLVVAALIADVLNRGFEPELRPRLCQLLHQHGDDLFGGAIAKQLAQGLFMPGDAVPVDQRDKIPLAIAGQGGFAEMRVPRQVVLRGDVQIGEIAAPAA